MSNISINEITFGFLVLVRHHIIKCLISLVVRQKFESTTFSLQTSSKDEFLITHRTEKFVFFFDLKCNIAQIKNLKSIHEIPVALRLLYQFVFPEGGYNDNLFNSFLQVDCLTLYGKYDSNINLDLFLDVSKHFQSSKIESFLFIPIPISFKKYVQVHMYSSGKFTIQGYHSHFEILEAFQKLDCLFVLYNHRVNQNLPWWE